MAAGDYKTALREGKSAWKAAERELGDSKTTGDLAFNYGFLEKTKGSHKNALKPLQRAVKLAKTAAVRVERDVELVAVMDGLEDYKGLKSYTDKALKNAQSNGMGNSVFAGELMVYQVNGCNRNAARAAKGNMRGERSGSRVKNTSNPEERLARIQEKCAKQADQALTIFKANPGVARSDFVAAAANAVGYAQERRNDWAGAAMTYQFSRSAIEKELGRGHPLVKHTIGRWVNSRSQLNYKGKLDAARQAGLKDNWPYIQDGPKVAEAKRVEADIGTSSIDRRRLSGYTILLTDVTDSGQTTNIRIVDSWPEVGYQKASKAALAKWQYAPKTGSEPAGFRKDIAVPFTFIVYDRDTQDTY